MGQKKIFILPLSIILVFCFITLGLLLGCQPSVKNKKPNLPDKLKSEAKIEHNRIVEHIEKLISLDFQGRRTGTQGEAEAALYLAQELKKIGVKPLGVNDTYFQTFPVPQMDLRWEGKRLAFYSKGSNSSLISDNVLGLITSPVRPEEYIILSAHFDHLGIWQDQLYPGANDNASGVSGVLEMARVLKTKEDLPYSIIIAFWSGEEMGLLGSNFFVTSPQLDLKKIKLGINLDSIGSGDKSNSFIFWSGGSTDITHALYSQWKEWPELNLSHQETLHNTSDHKSLEKVGVPAITILASDWLTNNHTSQDVKQGLNYEKIRFLTQNIADFLGSDEIEILLGNT